MNTEQAAIENIKSMGMKSMPLVFTSINPFKSLPWQLKCYKSFSSRGHQIVSVNHKTEIAHLEANRVPVSTVELSDGEVSLEKYGKPLGMIISILKRMRDFDVRDHYALVNSDILFAGKKACIVQFLADFPAAAMTRTDIAEQDADSNATGLPYRGGLDIFLFTRQGLVKTIESLENYPQTCEDMAIGIPGWDYMMGAVILTDIQGKILDSENLYQHAIHTQTYSDLSAFKSVASALQEKSLALSDEPHKAAAEFAERIEMECAINSHHARKISLIYMHHKAPQRHREICTLSELLSKNVAIALDRLYYRKDFLLVRKAIRSIRANGFRDFLSIKNIFLKGNSFIIKTSQLIACGSCILELNDEKQSFNSNYPPQNSHSKCIELIAAVEDKSERDFRIADLFYTELLQHRIFNCDAFNYIVSIQTDRLFTRLLSMQLNTIKTILQ